MEREIMSFQIEYPPGATPLNLNEMAGLIPTYISTQGELNAVEQDNISRGESWAFLRKRKNVLTEKFLRELHKKMFGLVWKWAGTYRNSNKSIGVEWFQIPAEIHKLLADVQYWITHETYPMDEIAARFHHRLVWIHPFPNGNGRWARTMADVLLYSLGHERFSWGAGLKEGTLSEHGEARRRYIRSLGLADARNYDELLAFVRS